MAFFATLDNSVDGLVRGLDFRVERQAAIASNIANADTPKYQAVDVSFASALEQAAGRLPLTTTSPNHFRGTAVRGGDLVVLSGGPARRDGNDVNVDAEMVKLAQNQIEYQFLTRALSTRFRWLKEAITGSASS